jgi:hypothetical protein
MSYDYSKIKKWTAGPPEELKVGMVLDCGENKDDPYWERYVHLKEFGNFLFDFSDTVRWAWHPDFKPEGE